MPQNPEPEYAHYAYLCLIRLFEFVSGFFFAVFVVSLCHFDLQDSFGLLCFVWHGEVQIIRKQGRNG